MTRVAGIPVSHALPLLRGERTVVQRDVAALRRQLAEVNRHLEAKEQRLRDIQHGIDILEG